MLTDHHKPCKHCGYEREFHRQDDLQCPRVKPHVVGVVNQWDYMTDTTYKQEGENDKP